MFVDFQARVSPTFKSRANDYGTPPEAAARAASERIDCGHGRPLLAVPLPDRFGILTSVEFQAQLLGEVLGIVGLDNLVLIEHAIHLARARTSSERAKGNRLLSDVDAQRIVELVERSGQQLVDAARRLDAARLDEHDAVAERARFVAVVGDVDERHVRFVDVARARRRRSRGAARGPSPRTARRAAPGAASARTRAPAPRAAPRRRRRSRGRRAAEVRHLHAREHLGGARAAARRAPSRAACRTRRWRARSCAGTARATGRRRRCRAARRDGGCRARRRTRRRRRARCARLAA